MVIDEEGRRNLAINLVEVYPHPSHTGHPVEAVLVGACSLWLIIPTHLIHNNHPMIVHNLLVDPLQNMP